ncbi:NAD(P)-dependent oxidoreductase [Chitinophaga eiseniae]|uniref:NAD(P)-dependent oxidoreductase n=1 Tax=Chitinophaga eiseniae TaxID=634771 RepID=A0A847SRW6_9BACT|nr:NAD(P)-dependent oxidoreductase [Chitinophaga eiseniae]NLR82335.1 NAD(P)-dependent oxidoreductase [Chitinophaga eiseniae]
METIAVLGLGRMGRGIASCLLKAGYHVIVWNRSADKATPLLQAGAIWAESPAAAASEAAVVIAMVADDQASEAVWLHTGGALAHMRSGSFLVECSTLSAKYVRQLAATAEARGVHYIDCPVTGLPEAAAAGQLTLLVGAAPETLEQVRPVLTSFSRVIRHFGPVGTGTDYKLLINLMGAVQIAALAEGIALAEQLGLDKSTVMTALEHSAAASPQVVRYIHRMANRDYMDDPNFTLSLRLKDATYGVALANSAGSPAPLGEAATAWFARACEQDPQKGHTDEAAVVDAVVAHRSA